MAAVHRTGQLNRWRNHRSDRMQRRADEFEAYLEANPIFRPELITEHPVGGRLMPMSYRTEGLYEFRMGQGVVFLDEWQLQLRTMQPTAKKAPPRRKRSRGDDYTSLVVRSMMKEKPMFSDIESQRQAAEALAEGVHAPVEMRAVKHSAGDSAHVMTLVNVAEKQYNAYLLTVESIHEARRIDKESDALRLELLTQNESA